MANAAAKKQAVANAVTLRTLHTVGLTINLLFLLSYFVLGRPGSIKAYIVFSLPAFFLQYQIERMGRPRYDARGSLEYAGENLSQAGLTEWFHDVIYVTWVCDILAILTGSNRVWFLYASIPLYATYKVYTMFFKGMLGGSKAAPEAEAAPSKSKRQEKFEKKGQRVKYSH